jgi:LacI family transcriptional regulator
MATIKDIAKKARVSIGTVDRVIHNRGRVSRQAEMKIRRAIDELDYIPNIFARHLKLAKDFYFGVLMPEQSQDQRFWHMPAAGILKALNELKTHRVQIRFFYYNRYSHESFFLAGRDMLKANLDGLLIAPVLTSAAGEFMQEIPENLPYVFFDSVIPESKCISSIVQDSYLSGRLSARLMQLLIRDPGTVAAIRVLPEDHHINERIRGFKEKFTEDGSSYPLKIYDINHVGDSMNMQVLMKKILREQTNLRGIFVSNALTFCAAQYLESRQIEGKIHVIGYDLIKENIHYLQNGTIDFLISQQSERQGYQGIYILFRSVVLKEEVPQRIMIPLDIITQDNIEFYQMS